MTKGKENMSEQKKNDIIMNLQIRMIALESIVKDEDEETHEKLVDYPALNHLFCPNCSSFDLTGGSTTDEHDTYLIIKCKKCGYQYSPSHDSP